MKTVAVILKHEETILEQGDQPCPRCGKLVIYTDTLRVPHQALCHLEIHMPERRITDWFLE